jgi:hypothetical protein
VYFGYDEEERRLDRRRRLGTAMNGVGTVLLVASGFGAFVGLGSTLQGYTSPLYTPPNPEIGQVLTADPHLRDVGSLKKLVYDYVSSETALAEQGVWNKPGTAQLQKQLTQFEERFGYHLNPIQEKALRDNLASHRQQWADILKQMSQVKSVDDAKTVYGRFVSGILPAWITPAQKTELLKAGNEAIDSQGADVRVEREWGPWIAGLCVPLFFGAYALASWGDNLAGYGYRLRKKA